MGSDRLLRWVSAAFGHGDESTSPTRISVIDARENALGRTLLAAQGFGAWLEPVEMRRFTLIAHQLRVRVVVVETPGFGPVDSGLSRSERRALMNGDFGALGARMFDAAMKVIDGADDGRISFLGFSLGASLAAAMAGAATASGWAVDELVLVEPVGVRSWRLGELLIAVAREKLTDKDYLALNDGFRDAQEPERSGNYRPSAIRYCDRMLLGAALRWGGLRGQLQSIAPAPHRVVVVAADQSSLTGSPAARAVAALRESGMPIAEVVVPGHHGFWHSLALVAAMTERLTKDPAAVRRSEAD